MYATTHGLDIGRDTGDAWLEFGTAETAVVDKPVEAEDDGHGHGHGHHHHH